MKAPNSAQIHFYSVFNRSTDTYWEPITFEEEGEKESKKRKNSPILRVAKYIQQIILHADLDLPPLIIAISDRKISDQSYQGHIFSPDSEIYSEFFSSYSKSSSHQDSFMPLRKFSHIRDKEIEYEEGKGPFPIIMIGYEDLIERFESNVDKGHALYQFWDSSIWHRYVFFS